MQNFDVGHRLYIFLSRAPIAPGLYAGNCDAKVFLQKQERAALAALVAVMQTVAFL
jgi:hypothetical protein